MTEANFDKNYWEDRWKDGETGWDIGHISKPLKEYIDQLTDKSLRILIPGCGNAWEGEYLLKSGFKNTWLVDISPEAVAKFLERFPEFPVHQVITGDFFDLNEKFDLILEQTFFCALDPSLRGAYAEKMHDLIRPGGRLVGLLFDTDRHNEHPPFGGSKEEYKALFDPLFDIEVLDRAHNSIKPRMGSELFISFRKA